MTAALLLSATTVTAADNSGFLTDYSKLKPIDGSDAMLYTSPNAYTDFKKYKAIMIDQPKFVIANDSKYKGVKPDDANAVADGLRAQLSDTMTKNGRLFVVDKPGPGVLYVSMAASNIHLKKKSRGLLGHTPAGFVVGGAVSAGQEMQRKIVLQDMNLKIEVQDSQTQQVLAAMVDKIDPGKKAKASESCLKEHTVMDYWANRFHCRLENSRIPESEWQDCEKALP
ncbi:MAG: DUF3313 domain-containing protein [Xanthomonadales bacterium]|nr:DUF3313 domain-containing protein [Xanthomonadales bacterium]